MSLVEQIQKDITAAMKAREEQRLSTLRMVKSALQNRQIEKMAPLDDKESQCCVDQYSDQAAQRIGGACSPKAMDAKRWPDKEAAEIVLIETYLPKRDRRGRSGRGEAESGDRRDGLSYDVKDMGTVMKNVMARFSGAAHARGWEDGQRSGEAGVGGGSRRRERSLTPL